MQERISHRLGLELYSLEATTPGELLFNDTYLPRTTKNEEHTIPELSSLPVVNPDFDYNSIDINYYNFISGWKTSGLEPNTKPLKQNPENYNGEGSQSSSDISLHIPKMNFNIFPLIRKTTLQELRIPGRLLVPLQVEFISWNPSKITKDVSEELSILSRSRQFLTVRKVLDSNTVILFFSSSNYPTPDSTLKENEIQLSLNLWKVNSSTFDNLNLNSKNHDESNDVWMDMIFITAREFIDVVWFILKSFQKTINDSKFSKYPLSYPPFFGSRTRSNIKELLEGKTLMKYIPNDLSKDILPSQVDFMVGLFEQITTYRTHRPCSSKTKISVLKLQDFERGIKKCISFYYFSIPNKHSEIISDQ